jgi:hypothetical protein
VAKKSPLKGLVIRSAAVRLPDVGYIIACDPTKERDDIPHACLFRWRAGVFNMAERNYNSHSLCVTSKPDIGYLEISGQGYYSITLASGTEGGDVFEQSAPPPKKKRTASFRSVAAIEGTAYAVGLRGLVYRFDDIDKWTRIDEGLPETFNIQAIDGFGPADLFAVGRQGGLWQFDGTVWSERELPTSENLTSVKCAGDGKVYVGGHKGVLISGRDDAWTSIDHRETEDNIWDLEWFERNLYVSTMHTVYRLKGDGLEQLNFGSDRPKSCYQLSAAKGVMWSIGEFDIMSFDGNNWSRVV